MISHNIMCSDSADRKKCSDNVTFRETKPAKFCAGIKITK